MTGHERAQKHQSGMMDKLLSFFAHPTAYSNISLHGTPYQYPQAAHQTLEEKYGKYGIIFKQNMGQIWDFLRFSN